MLNIKLKKIFFLKVIVHNYFFSALLLTLIKFVYTFILLFAKKKKKIYIKHLKKK